MADHGENRVKCYRLGFETDRLLQETYGKVDDYLRTVVRPNEINRFTGHPLSDSTSHELSELKVLGNILRTVGEQARECTDDNTIPEAITGLGDAVLDVVSHPGRDKAVALYSRIAKLSITINPSPKP
jgi:hypothetical protein